MRAVPAAHPRDLPGGRIVEGTQLAAASAEVVFVNALSKPTLKRQIDTLRSPAAAAGRDPQGAADAQCGLRPHRRGRPGQVRGIPQAGELLGGRYSGWIGLDMAQFDPDMLLRHVKTNAGQTMVDPFSKMDPGKEWTPHDIADFIELVVPELQRRGTMWTEYEDSTLRERLYGLGTTATA